MKRGAVWWRWTAAGLCLLLAVAALLWWQGRPPAGPPGSAASTARPATSAAAAAPTRPASETVVPDDRTVRRVGRVSAYADEPGVWLSWTCSGIAFTFEGTAAVATLGTGEPWLSQAGQDALVGVFVDGAAAHSAVFTVGQREQTVTLAEGLAPGTHTIRLLKLSETSRSAAVQVRAVQVQGSGIRPAPAPQRVIEFVGDSITAGYGTRAATRNAPYSTTEEDGSLSYAYLAAQAVGAEAEIVAVSGNGVYCNDDGGREDLMPSLYAYTDLLFERAVGRTIFTPWSNRDRANPPQAVVINLGTNDQYTVLRQGKEAAFQAAYAAFLRQLRQANPDAALCVILGTMKYDIWPAIEQTVAQYQAETGDERVYTYRFPYRYTDIEGGVTARHPAAAVHARMAADLAVQLRRWIRDREQAADAP